MEGSLAFDLGLEGVETEEVFEATTLGMLGRLCLQHIPVPLPITVSLLIALCQSC